MNNTIRGLKKIKNFLIVVLHKSVSVFQIDDDQNSFSLEYNYELKIRKNLRLNIISTAESGIGEVMSIPGTSKTKLQIYHLRENRVILDLKVHKSRVLVACLNSNATLIATVSKKARRIKVFNIKGELIHEIERTKTRFLPVEKLLFSPCSRLLVCGDTSRLVHFYKLDIKKLMEPGKAVFQRKKTTRRSTKENASLYFSHFVLPTPMDAIGGTHVVGFNVSCIGKLALVVNERYERILMYEISEHENKLTLKISEPTC